MYRPSPNETLALARTLYGEARGEGAEGMAAVAHVIINRRWDSKGRWPKSIEKVCHQPWQFSCWNNGDPNRDKIKALTEEDLATNYDWRLAYSVAMACLAGVGEDVTEGANHYFNPNVVYPEWAKGVTPTVKVLNHVFLKL